ncbi:MAG: hypothetical protein E7161_04410 [Firmicutes bacterium]|nr:hypothetical protein [Bacillota bacterium]
MATSKSKAKKNIDSVLSKTTELIFTKIDENIEHWYNESERILNYLFVVSKQNTIEKQEDELNKFRKKEKVNIDFIEFIIKFCDSEEFSNKNKFERLRHNYYKIKNDLLEIKNDILSKRIDNYSSELNTNNQKLNGLENKFEGIGATVISIIASVSFISAGITGIDSISPIFIPLFIFGIVWLGITFIVFINCLFRKDNFNNIIAIIFYGIITFVTLAILIFTMIYVYNDPNILNVNVING